MIKILLSSLFLAVSAFGFAQDSLFSKVYTTDHDYTVKAQTIDQYGNLAHVGLYNYDFASFAYLDSLGNVLFSKQYNWPNGPATALQFRTVKPTSDGNFITVGDFFMPDQGANVGICAKIDSTGDLIWSEIIVPANPQFFKCADVIESMEHTFWVTGHDEQTGELSVLEIDQSGTQLQSFSFKNSGFRLENKTILELDTNQLVLVGSQLEQNGSQSGHAFSIDKSGNVLWSNTHGTVHFLAAQNDSNNIWIASSYDYKMALSTIAHDGSPVHVVSTQIYLDPTEDIGFSRLRDSTLAFSHGSSMNSDLILLRANSGNSTYALRLSHPLMHGVAISPSNNGGMYWAGNGPMFGIKSLNSNNHSALIRLDSALLTMGICTTNPDPFLTSDNLMLPSDPLTLTTTAAASVNPGTLGVSDLTVNGQLGCIDFYGGLNEEDPNHLTIFPNPANTVIRLQFENASSGMIEITTMDGKVVQQSKISGNNASVSVEKLVAGTYLYRFTSSNNAISRGKLVIE